MKGKPIITQAMLDGLDVGHQFDAPPILGGFMAPVVWTVNRINPGVEYVFDLACMGIALCSVVATVRQGSVVMEEL